MSNATHIYALHDPRTWEIVYVGKSDNPAERLKMHMRRPIRLGLSRLVQELNFLGLKLQVSILQSCLKSQWPIWEKFWIATVRNSGEPILNIFSGGNGAPTYYTREHRQHISSGLKGKPKSPEHRRKLSLANLGKVHTPEEIARQAASQRGKKKKPCSAERKAKISAAHLGKKRGPQKPEHRKNWLASQAARWERYHGNQIQLFQS